MKAMQLAKNDMITESAWQKLIGELQSGEITATVNQGNVALYGTVNSYLKKVIIEKLISQITGVKSIANQIDVHLDRRDRKQDEEIKNLIMECLKQVTSEVNEQEKNGAEIAYWEIFN